MPVTLLKLVNQKILRYKTQEKDWYNAVVIWVEEKEIKGKEKWIKNSYSLVTEFPVSKDFMETYEIGTDLSFSLIEGIEEVNVVWKTKGRWFQWVMKKHGFGWWRKTHGSHFHRKPWSIGNMKPNRVNKWHPLPWHMWNQKITMKKIKVMDKFDFEWDTVLALKGSLPGSYNSLLKISI